jgi:hypothetical protein
MELKIITNQEIWIDNVKCSVVSIDPEIPSAYTHITLKFLEGPLEGLHRHVTVNNTSTTV